MTLIVTLLGGESTGKSSLARSLQQHLSRNTSLRTICVPENLRLWCTLAGRAPQAHEQAALAAEQHQLIVAAIQAQPAPDMVIADTTPLVIAAYSELYFNDSSLLAGAIAHQRGYHLNLLMGLDLPWVPDGLFRDSPVVRDAIDAILRRVLQAANLPFQTIYGRGDVRLHQALTALNPLLDHSLFDLDQNQTFGRVPWNCETCSDPACEHQIFTALLQKPSS
ncbi:ATP-binding protein [Hydrogenophaga sp.]|uniref:ATP-binding protein n=1 Tax=Hydrogenophaga sp. TaxID=1904254 RepID=UPI00272647FB|nr:ATP-binding protein [Hydrogenophaga sp.]MDO8904906.1 ATP-binding protein [Hydrogenophaga sp.]